MAILKCKMCGGDMEISADKTFGTCEYCGSTMTLPKVMEDEQRAAAFNRGNHFRRTCDFDKALAVYERIVAENDGDAEAHWCCALCRFGIEYVEDPASMEYVPTCHRASFDSFLEDVDYLAAVEHSEGLTQRQYQKDAAKIAEVQRGILATSQTTEPFDVFICYKETGEDGQRTRDSIMAQDIYYQLTEAGYRVFFSRITLEDVVGTQYEPYIFAALNSAKVMVAVGTAPEHFSAVWVKNEWSRFLAMMKKDRTKLLLPCYRDMDPYDLPEQLSVLQSYDMGKIGFIQDLIRGIAKVIDAGKQPAQVVHTETVVMQNAAGNATVEPLLKRAFMFMEDEDWVSADEYCEKVLDIDPECARAYLGKLMAELRVKKQEELKNCAQPFDGSGNYQKVMRFGDEALKTELTGYIEFINNRNEQARLQGIYDAALAALEGADTEEKCVQAAEQFESIPDFKDAAQQAQACREKAAAVRLEREEQAEIARKDEVLAKAKWKMMIFGDASNEEAIRLLERIPGWKDADQLAEECRQKRAEFAARAEQERQARERRQAEAAARAERNKKRARKGAVGLGAVICVAIVVAILFNTVVRPAQTYKTAASLMEQGDVLSASIYYGKAGNWKDAPERVREIRQQRATFATTLSAGGNVTAGVRTDGMTQVVGADTYGQSRVSGWTDIVEVAAGSGVTVGLKADGTVVAVGLNEDGQCNVSGWTDIVAVAASSHVVGLKADGTVVATGKNNYGQCNVSGWTDIVAVSAGGSHTVGLKADGTVVAVGGNGFDKCDVSGWRDIVAVSAGYYDTVGLKQDGTVVVAGNNSDQTEIGRWTDIVAVSAGMNHIVGLKADGTVVATGRNNFGQCNVSGWRDIVAVSAGNEHTVGLKADGTVVSHGFIGDALNKLNKVFGWRIKLPSNN